MQKYDAVIVWFIQTIRYYNVDQKFKTRTLLKKPGIIHFFFVIQARHSNSDVNLDQIVSSFFITWRRTTLKKNNKFKSREQESQSEK